MKKSIVGILAHVDAGKTTLAESLLCACGVIERAGRVDHGDAFLDNGDMERKRGITIFSKQARIRWKDVDITLLDTPGHVDFSAEMERTLQVLDAAVLVIDGSDGVQGDVHTLWRLLKRYEVPVFLFVNKMDQPGTDPEKVLTELQKKLDSNITSVGKLLQPGDNEGERETELEHAAMCSEALMEEYLETGELSAENISDTVAERKLFPCFFGSALKQWGITELLDGLNAYLPQPEYPEEFGARVYKIGRDNAGIRLSYLKVTGGSLRVKMPVGNSRSGAGEEIWEEKCDQLRLYNGGSYEAVDTVKAGEVCAVTGLTKTFAGQGLGYESENSTPILEPVLTYRLLLPPEVDPVVALGKLRQLEEEEPQLHVLWQEENREIHMQVMGQVQMEILKNILWERFGLEVEFDAGSIVYKETLAEPVEGIGHFEPLRHYAEVHLLLEPGERGSGLQFASLCSEDMLDRNWQRLILTHLEEKEHLGVLTGSPITDMQITLLTGRAHQKHTEGGDFRQATYRAVRQGLKKAETVLLEPYYSFRLEVPAENVGRAMTDIQRMQGTFQGPETQGELSVLTGSAPVAKMRDYQSQVVSYTRGRGHMTCTLNGYEPCQDQEQIAEEIGYDSERDLENPTGSVFCAHGAGFVVPWYEVEEYMHLEGTQLPDSNDAYEDSDNSSAGVRSVQGTAKNSPDHRTANAGRGKYTSMYGSYEEEKELKAIFEKTFGPVSSKKYSSNSRSFGNPESGSSFSGKGGKGAADSGLPAKSGHGAWRNSSPAIHREDYLLVDGCNIIFAWEDLRDLAQADFHAAQSRLMDILSDYQGIKGCILILVFDAYRVEGHPEETFQYHNIHVLYTKEAETADQYIERTVHKIGRKHNVTVATSDGLEQIIIMGQGAARISARGFKDEIASAKQQMREEWQERRDNSKTYLFDSMTPELKSHMEDIRLGRKKKEEL